MGLEWTVLHIIPRNYVTSVSTDGWQEGTGSDSKKSGMVKLYGRSVERENSLHHSEFWCEYAGENSEVPYLVQPWKSETAGGSKMDEWRRSLPPREKSRIAITT